MADFTVRAPPLNEVFSEFGGVEVFGPVVSLDIVERFRSNLAAAGRGNLGKDQKETRRTFRQCVCDDIPRILADIFECKVWAWYLLFPSARDCAS